MKGFRDFLLQTNALALAIGVIIGGAVGKVVSSLVKDILMPPLGLLIGRVDFSNFFVNLGSTHYDTLADAQKAGAPTLNLGLFLNTIVDFLIIALCVFVITKIAMKPAPPGPDMKDCPQCAERVPAVAKRCRYCTSQL
ncbi:MAG TPA: large conductance mechanosensitive channel protein MscL [Candidatus Polarisedimenticolia bacterium]|jgi:large conductance mechanosensitive channel|nr:large conductance mechanosensitive channel protein MscL [Candidatus Polarisedimenticolia bacterium]